ncbi:MAG: hypothetical protein K2X39_05570 [Silvanigrellaceae bacterium]|nr:hypothetical protein [Silvanigrellaceae bacterium]
MNLKKFSFDGDKKELFIFSRMRQGLACVDGPDFCTELGFGETLHISMPQECSLNLIKKIRREK